MKFLIFSLIPLFGLVACMGSNPPAATQPKQVEVGRAQPGSAIEAKPIAPVTAQTAAPIPPVWAQTGKAVEAAPIAPVRAQAADAIQQLGAKEGGREVRIVVPADVLFDFDQANIRLDAAAGLQKILTVIRFYDKAPLRIEGHTDAIGNDSYNQALSERRADSVKQWLITQGNVVGDRMTTSGFGESQPRAENTKPDGADDPAGRQQNRRVEIVIEKS